MHRLTQGNYETKLTLDRKDELGQLSEDFNTLAFTLPKTSKYVNAGLPIFLMSLERQ